MASITYNPPPGEAETTRWNGVEFKKGKSVDVKDQTMLRKAQNNPHFKVSGGKEEERQAEVMGNYRDPNTGQDVTLIRQAPTAAYLGASGAGDTRPVPPSAANQYSVALEAAREGKFEEAYGAPQAEVQSGEYEGAPEFKGPEGTVAKRGRPPKQQQ